VDNYIKIEDCKNRYTYEINSRNLSYGVFDQNDGGFIGIREKFGDTYLFREYHWDLGANNFGTVQPLKEIEILPDSIKLDENETHPLGDLWAKNPNTDMVEPVARVEWYNYSPETQKYELDKSKEEPLHGKRNGFADYWVVDAKVGERLPDNLYPFVRGNEKLFEYLKKFENLVE